MKLLKAPHRMQEFGVQGYPTLKYFGEEKDSPSDYQGGRDSASLTNFILGEWRKSQPPPEVQMWGIILICLSTTAIHWTSTRAFFGFCSEHDFAGKAAFG